MHTINTRQEAIMKTIKMKQVLVAVALATSFCALADREIKDRRPATEAKSTWYSVGNGRLGCLIDGGVRVMKLGFCVQPDAKPARAVVNCAKISACPAFGELEIRLGNLPEGQYRDYSREMDLDDATYEDEFEIARAEVERKVYASVREDAIVIVLKTPEACDISMALRDARAKGEKTGATTVAFSGSAPDGAKYAARADVVSSRTKRDDGELEKVTVIKLRAVTGTDALSAP